MAKSKSKANVTNIKKSAGKAVSKTYTKANHKKAAVSQQAQTAVEAPVETTSADVKPPIIPCGIPVLDNIVNKTKPIPWREVSKSLKEEKELYAVHSVEQVLLAAYKENTPLVEYAGDAYYFTGTHYEPINNPKLSTFLSEAAR